MQYVVTAVPLLLIGLIVTLIAASALRGRVAWPPRARTPRARPARPVKSSLFVSREQMDADLNDLIRRS